MPPNRVGMKKTIPRAEVTIYTDGACLGNPGPGGYAAVILTPDGEKELARGFRLTTNNRMELMAAIAALRSLSAPAKVRLFSDSQYVVNGMRQGWARRWKAQNWMRSKTEPALNADLWDELLRLDSVHDIEWIWIRGHAKDPYNERCDRLSNMHASRHATEIDAIYERSLGRSPEGG